ncbi:hypothetical protein [uncultured Sphingomonas sp.]|uniref:hypothetical protein n=1 Tax=uncultured Sphingomonas sp. TaxID=158754 RepID=UPI0030F90635
MTPLIFLLALAAPQVAATPTASSQKTVVDDKKTCRLTKLLGSQIPKRICHTQAEWHVIDNADEVNRSRVMEGRRFSGQ